MDGCERRNRLPAGQASSSRKLSPRSAQSSGHLRRPPRIDEGCEEHWRSSRSPVSRLRREVAPVGALRLRRSVEASFRPSGLSAGLGTGAKSAAQRISLLHDRSVRRLLLESSRRLPSDGAQIRRRSAPSRTAPPPKLAHITQGAFSAGGRAGVLGPAGLSRGVVFPRMAKAP